MRDCGACGRTVSSDWHGTLCPYCGANLIYSAVVLAVLWAMGR
jgi:DNA-directed RNA polymerase subunit RPC12/RpoP